MIVGFTQYPMVIQNVNDVISLSFNFFPNYVLTLSLDLAATAMAVDKFPTRWQSTQFLAVHHRVIHAVHCHIGTEHPVMVGFVKPIQSPAKIPIVKPPHL